MLNKLFRRRPLIEELEPRILFSADLAPFALDSFSPVPEQRTIQSDGEFSSIAATTRNELIIVDTRVDGYETLLNDILNQAGSDRQFSVVLLDRDRDGIEQITDALKQYSNLDALHLISHGDAGLLQLGNSRLDLAALSNRSTEVTAWGTAFGAEGDLLIYGCDVAAGDTGKAFLTTLAQLTGADVAASIDPTGTRSLGGNWALEFINGRIESAGLIAENNTLNWMGTLAITQSGVNSTASSGAVTTISFSHTVEAGGDRLLIVELANSGSAPATSVQYNGINLTLLVDKPAAGSALNAQLWFLVAPTVGSGTVSVTLASAQHVVVGAATFYGVDQTTPLGTPVVAFGNSSPSGVTVVANSGEIVIDIVGSTQVTSSTVGAGQTTLFTNSQGTNATDIWATSSTELGAASVSMTQTFTAGTPKWGAVAVAIKPSGAPANTAPILDSSKSPIMLPMAEDAGSPSGAVGTLVSSLVDFASPSGEVDNVTDPDAGAQLGIAVTTVDNANGSWFYTTDNGTIWNALGGGK